jgi:hypothetical protein
MNPAFLQGGLEVVGVGQHMMIWQLFLLWYGLFLVGVSMMI